MDRNTKRFLGITFAFSYICFGAVIASRQPFSHLSTPMFLLFLSGCLGPLAGAVGVYQMGRPSLGGLKGLWRESISGGSLKSGWLFAPLFLLLHYGLALVLRAAHLGGQAGAFFRYLPVMLILFGTGEPGWRGIVQPGIEAARGGFWRSCVITGLFWSLWFLPMLFIPGFVIQSDFYIQFAAYLVGIGLLLSTLRKKSGLPGCILFSTFFFALSAVVVLRQSNYLLAVVLVDVIIALAYNSRLFRS